MSLQTEWTENNLRRATAAVSTGLLTFGVTAALTYGYLGLQRHREQYRQWSQVQTLAGSQDYSGCLASIPQISSESRYFSAAQPLLHQCRLGQAQQKAEKQDWVGALASANLIPESSEEEYQVAQPLIADWSDKVMLQSRTLLSRGELEQALTLLRAVPNTSPVAVEVQKALEEWPADWEKNETLVAKAQDLLKKGQWLAAKQSLEEISESPFWKKQVAPLQKQAEDGIAAVRQYEIEQSQQRAALAAAPQEVYIPPAQPSPVPSGGGAPPLAPPAPPIAAPPPPVVAAAPSFNQNLESLYQSYLAQGQANWDAWTQACRDVGGQLVDQGPEAACLP